MTKLTPYYYLRNSYRLSLAGRSLRFWLVSLALLLVVSFHGVANASTLNSLGAQAVSDATRFQSVLIPLLAAGAVLALIVMIAFAILNIIKSQD